MKRLFATSLVLLLLYHAVGQALTFWVAEWQEDQQLSQNLSVYHSTDDLIEFEIPVPLHQYGATSTEVNGGGEFEYDGKFYNIARQELRNDTLHLFCYQDGDELQRHTDLRDFIQKNGAGDDRNAPGKSGHPTKITTPDYAQRTGGHLIFVYEDCQPSRPLSPSLSYASVLLFTQSPPPRLRA